MTRATLLHVLDHATAISPAEVRELEQLAQAFPYCQTAHVLLAKAAHDQGTMLAGQRLRRAATYAADRELLRRLIEQVAPSVVVEEPAPAPLAPEPDAWPLPAAAPVPVEPVVAAPPISEPEPAALPEPMPGPVAAELPAPAPVSVAITSEPEALIPEAAPVAPAAGAPAAAPITEPLPALGSPELVPSMAPPQAAPPAREPAAEVPAARAEAAPEAEEPAELPAVAPPIRPPAEQGAARFEFGLAEKAPSVVTPYVLPALAEELELLPNSRSATAPPAPPADPTAFSAAAFTGDEAVGYDLGLGSRGGYALALREQLAGALASWDVPAAALPPVGADFEPDVLLTEHWAPYAVVLPAPSSLDLINNFLRRQPRLSRPAAPTPMTEAQVQADLSVQSTRPEPELASESLARILARQGKNERAIEIYQRLMVKQPEKMAYFAAQIQSLQPPA